MYVYRALRPNELYNKMLLCKEYFKYAPQVYNPSYNEHFGEDALDLVGAHLTKGNTTITPWISCTKDSERVKHYLYDKGDAIYGMAIIKNHDKNYLESNRIFKLSYEYKNNNISEEQLINEIRSLCIHDISKCVLDFSTGRSSLFDQLIDCNLVHFGDDRIRKHITRWEYNYSQSNREVIVLGEIPSSDAFILDPLLIDILKYLKVKKLIVDINDELLKSLIDKFVIQHSLLAYDDVRTEDMLKEPLKSIYINLNDMLKEVFDCIFIYKKSEDWYIQNKAISFEYMNFLIDYLITIILDKSNYLKELGLTQENPTPNKLLIY